jgi:hypothetical protein
MSWPQRYVLLLVTSTFYIDIGSYIFFLSNSSHHAFQQ